MNYATIKTHDIANGPGVRVSLFVSGCTHHCKGCFNPETWNFQYGTPFTQETEQKILAALEPWYISGLTLLGGEPFEPQNQAALLPFVQKVKETWPEREIWCYTGYDYERDILAGRLGDWEITRGMLNCLDVLVDGKFIMEKKDITLRFRGSSNQRIIDVPKSLAADQVVLWTDDQEKEAL
jgi:anaerobic ribonucleoside-triphosphate reductase activating protein